MKKQKNANSLCQTQSASEKTKNTLAKSSASNKTTDIFSGPSTQNKTTETFAPPSTPNKTTETFAPPSTPNKTKKELPKSTISEKTTVVHAPSSTQNKTTDVFSASHTHNKTTDVFSASHTHNKAKKMRPNFSKAHKLYIRHLRRDKFWIFFFRVFILVAFLGLWEILTRYKVMDPFFFSSPSRICAQIVTLARAGTLWTDIWVTLSETLIGFAIATVLGYAIAILLWWNEKVRRVFEPYIVVLNSLPKIALGPIIILWVGAGTKAIVVMCVLICIVITTMSMLSAFLSVEEGKILLLKSMHANKFQILRKLVLPNSMPDFVSVLKINVGMSCNQPALSLRRKFQVLSLQKVRSCLVNT